MKIRRLATAAVVAAVGVPALGAGFDFYCEAGKTWGVYYDPDGIICDFLWDPPWDGWVADELIVRWSGEASHNDVDDDDWPDDVDREATIPLWDFFGKVGVTLEFFHIDNDLVTDDPFSCEGWHVCQLPGELSEQDEAWNCKANIRFLLRTDSGNGWRRTFHGSWWSTYRVYVLVDPPED